MKQVGMDVNSGRNQDMDFMQELQEVVEEMGYRGLFRFDFTKHERAFFVYKVQD